MGRVFLSFLFLVSAVVASADTAAEKEWHEYCDMMIHVKVDGWVVDKTITEQPLRISPQTLKCKATTYRDFESKNWTKGEVSLSADALPAITVLRANAFNGMIPVLPGSADEAAVCAPVLDLLKKALLSRGVVQVKVLREVVRQDWASAKNTDVKMHEKLSFSIDGVHFNTSTATSLRGKYCSQKPVP
jgi:hypothetical protein